MYSTTKDAIRDSLQNAERTLTYLMHKESTLLEEYEEVCLTDNSVACEIEKMRRALNNRIAQIEKRRQEWVRAIA